MPPGPKFQERGGAVLHPPILGPFGVSCPFLSLGFRLEEGILSGWDHASPTRFVFCVGRGWGDGGCTGLVWVR